jgi:tetratricopeptide (TPR) repeat protein
MKKISLTFWKVYLVCSCLFFLQIRYLSAQNTTEILALAEQYISNQEYDKARETLEKVTKSKNFILVYPAYLQTLLKLKDFKEAEKTAKKAVKENPQNPIYRIDVALVLEQAKQIEKADKENNKIVDEIKKQPDDVILTAHEYWLKLEKPEWANKLIAETRKTRNLRNLFALEMAETYRTLNQTEKMIEEYILYATQNQANLETVKGYLQDNLQKPENFDKLEKMLLTETQKDSQESAYNELLLWLYLQQKRFLRAFVQAKSLDKRYQMGGSEMVNIGQIALKNQDYEGAKSFFEYVVQTYPNTENYSFARNLYLKTREEIIKNSYPTNLEDIKSLVVDYDKLIQELGKTTRTLDAMRSKALLLAFYLDKKEDAIAQLEEALTLSVGRTDYSAKCKIDLGNIYLLKNETWEATLLYSQAEKLRKEDPIGYEAKLQNAKLSYYKGEFELAKEHLDILKQATTREISNDAIDLSLFIQDNTAEDSLGVALQAFSKIELMIFQNKQESATEGLKLLKKSQPESSLSDDILLLQAKLAMKMGKFEEAIEFLSQIIIHHPDDILGDDAEFLTGKIQEDNLKNKDKAMEHYEKILTKYPGSIYTAEARKRFRTLRGDIVN